MLLDDNTSLVVSVDLKLVKCLVINNNTYTNQI